MWARTLCPLSSSTRKKAFGSDSTILPSISMAPSFLGMSSALRFPAVASGLSGRPPGPCIFVVPCRSSSVSGFPRSRAHTQMLTGYGDPSHGCLRAFGENRAGETHGPQVSLRDINRQCERGHKPGYSVLAQGGDPLEPPLAQGPVPSSRGLGPGGAASGPGLVLAAVTAPLAVPVR